MAIEHIQYLRILHCLHTVVGISEHIISVADSLGLTHVQVRNLLESASKEWEHLSASTSKAFRPEDKPPRDKATKPTKAPQPEKGLNLELDPEHRELLEHVVNRVGTQDPAFTRAYVLLNIGRGRSRNQVAKEAGMDPQAVSRLVYHYKHETTVIRRLGLELGLRIGVHDPRNRKLSNEAVKRLTADAGPVGSRGLGYIRTFSRLLLLLNAGATLEGACATTGVSRESAELILAGLLP